ncbi:MAG TPA: tRNA (adenosine(37)-N6)-threonylcarbamoyltransferase complex ATPase subunit type 1 TsaE [Flavobacterium sp.]|nr:tRNA (adenosine(37)-N6)-threonylcarbamoyltransferase complex ATPase subunit type 1 TsaE [Flavobacterium sp.]
MEITFSLDEVEIVAKKILATPNLKKIILFEASMGAGKTTLIKALVKELGVKQNTNSPTFSIVNEYRTTDLKPIYHFDLYRLKNEIEAYDMGLDEYFYSDDWCFIEWPEKTPNLIPINHAKICIQEIENNKRHLILIN